MQSIPTNRFLINQNIVLLLVPNCCHFLPFSSQFLFFLFFYFFSFRWLLTCHNVNQNWSRSRRIAGVLYVYNPTEVWASGFLGTIYVGCIYLAFCFHFCFSFISSYFLFYFGMPIFWLVIKEGLASLNPWLGWLRLNPALYLSWK